MKHIHIKKEGRVFVFPVTIEMCEEGGFFAFTPIIQGAHAEGETYTEVIEILEDVIRRHIELRLQKGEFIPSLESKGELVSTIPLPVRL